MPDLATLVASTRQKGGTPFVGAPLTGSAGVTLSAFQPSTPLSGSLTGTFTVNLDTFDGPTATVTIDTGFFAGTSGTVMVSGTTTEFIAPGTYDMFIDSQEIDWDDGFTQGTVTASHSPVGSATVT